MKSNTYEPQKYDIVKIKREDKLTECVLDYTWMMVYGGKPNNTNGDWNVLFLDDGSSLAWVDPDTMTFVRHGTITDLENTKQTKIKTKERNSDLKYIKDCLLSQEKELSSISVLKLFEEICFDTSFNRNGEYYVLQQDFCHFHPIFKAIFDQDKAKMFEEIKIKFLPEYVEEYSETCLKLYEKVSKLN